MSDEDFKLILVGLIKVANKGSEGLPSGQLYANLMAEGADLNRHKMVVGTLKQCGLITEEHYLLKITPKGRKEAESVLEALS